MTAAQIWRSGCTLLQMAMRPGALIGLLLVLASCAGLGPVTDEQAKLEDATWYANEHRVSVEEALRRMDVQIAREPVLDQAVEIAGDRYAGTWLEHEPAFRQVFLITGQDQPAALEDLAAKAPIAFDIITGATHSWADLRAAQHRIRELLGNEYPEVALGLDLPGNAVRIEMVEPLSSDDQDAMREAAGVRVVFGEGEPFHLLVSATPPAP